ncbi:hypothetical protein ACF0H5_006851 [Mactra antiquata]
MSIFGKPQESYTVKSSWELLDSPIPLRQPHKPTSTPLSPSLSPNRPRSTSHQSRISPSSIHQIDENEQLENNIQSGTDSVDQTDNENIVTEHSNVATIEQTNSDITLADIQTVPELLVDVTTQYINSTEQNNSNADTVEDRHSTIQNTEIEQQHSSSQSAATYVCTQRRQQDNIADTIALEFEQHARRSRSSYRRQYLDNIIHHSRYDNLPQLSDLSNNTVQTEGSENPVEQRTESQIREESNNSWEMNHHTVLQHQTDTTQDLTSRNTTDVHTMSQSTNHVSSVTSDDRNISVLPDTGENISTRHTDDYVSNYREVDDGTRNNGQVGRFTRSSRHINSSRSNSRQRRRDNISQRTEEQLTERHQSFNNNNNNIDDVNEVDNISNSYHGNQGDTESNHQPSPTSRDRTIDTTTSTTTHSRLNGDVDTISLPRIANGSNITVRRTQPVIEPGSNDREDPGSNISAHGSQPVIEPGSNVRVEPGSIDTARDTQSLIEPGSEVRAHVTIPQPMIQPGPYYHPPPTIVQNGGISQNDLLDLMSKGLGNFTTEMASILIDKIKPEYEILAKKVGQEVKEATVSELGDLRAKLKESQYQLESLSDERDLLKTENIKERDLMKREFEKDRLKRLKDSEEKNELIDKLKAENSKLLAALKDKDKHLKKADFKVKAEETKRLKCEEEAEKRIKEMQKELDKVKGELLMFKSKKRLQVSSAKNRKDSVLSKLNSHHGIAKHFEQLPYHEGDEG